MTWEIVHDVALERVRRMKVTSGWLYQVELFIDVQASRFGENSYTHSGWHPPVFVPDGGK